MQTSNYLTPIMFARRQAPMCYERSAAVHMGMINVVADKGAAGLSWGSGAAATVQQSDW